MENILLLVVVLLGLVVVFGICLAFCFKRKLEQVVNSPGIYKEGLIDVQAAFERQLSDLSSKFAEEYAALKFFEDLGDTKINISHISTEAQKRVYALGIKKGETAIVLCEKSLSEIRERINYTQEQIAGGTNLEFSISRLKDQEKLAMKHLEEARMRLASLVKVGLSA